MSEVVMEDVWVEVEANRLAALLAPRTSRSSIETRRARMDIEGSPFICRCWRCKGGALVSLEERGRLDQIMARHLLRMSDHERDTWLRQWSAVPNHGPEDLRALNAWMAIERGESVGEPIYLPRRLG